MFIGEYYHTIDAKGRVIIPSKYRNELQGTIVVQKGVDGNLVVYSETAWSDYELKVRQLPSMKQNGRAIKRFLYSQAEQCELDKQGRLNIPARFIEMAGLEKDVVIVGNGETMEIWSKDRWEEVLASFDPEKISQDMEEFGGIF